jgi:serine phosphatase RsbU (regulator of sigma subunit)/putative methionine-R-sulfoxide reductase with GAF domain
MPIPSFPQAGLDVAQPGTLVAGLLCILAGAGIGLWIAGRRAKTTSAIDPDDRLAGISRALAEIQAAGSDPVELAEAAYLQIAQLLPCAGFQMGVYDRDEYRTLLRIEEGDKYPNLTLRVEAVEGNLPNHPRIVPPSGAPAELDTALLAESGSLFGASEGEPTGFVMVKPLQAESTSFGLIGIRRADHTPYSRWQQLVFSLVVDQISHTLEMQGLQQEAANRGKMLRMIDQVSRRLSSLKPLEESFAHIAGLLLRALERDQVRLFELMDDELVLKACQPGEIGDSDLRIPLGFGPVGQVGEEGRMLQYASVPHQAQDEGERTVSGLAIPLRVEGKVLGVLDITSSIKRPFSDDEIKMAEMVAAQLAIATLETRNFTRLREESYVRTVLLEVARHAARPGDPGHALQSVLQLTTLIAGTRWAVLLIADEPLAQLRVGPVAGIRRADQDAIQGMVFDFSEFGMQASAQQSETSMQVRLPEPLAGPLGTDQVTGFALNDGEVTLGLLLIEATPAAAERTSLQAGIAHQVSLRLENVRLMQEASQRQALENEIAMAHDIQTSFLPREVPHHEGWEIGISWASAREVGGDFYDFIQLDPSQSGTRWGIAIADVSGKSVPAALFMAVSRTLLRSIAPSHVDPGLVLRRMNSMLKLETLSDFFVSLFYAVWEPETGSILCANGGHNPPLLVESDGASRWLKEHGVVLGVKEDASYSTQRCQLAEGSLLILYTDGVTEASEPSGQFYGTDRLQRLCEKLHHLDAQSIADSVAREVREFSAVDALSDDLTILALKRVPHPAGA